MGIELITGMGGTNHVDSEDVGALNAELIGNGNYLLSGCEVTMTDANTCHVAAGELLLQGRHVRIKGAGEDVSIGNGQVGYNQRYLICLVYSKATSGIETVELQAFAGAKTTGTATDPAVAVGSILGGDTNVVVPLARLELTGLSVGTPAVMLDSVKGLVALGAETKKIGDSVSLEVLKPNLAFTVKGGYLTVARFGNVVCVNLCDLVIGKQILANNYVTLASGLPPALDGLQQNAVLSLRMNAASSTWTLVLRIGADGVMTIANFSPHSIGASDVISGRLVYIAK